MSLKKLYSVLHSLSLPASDYASPSFHTGEASFAFQAAIPVDLIKIRGNSHSDSVLLHLMVPLSTCIRLQSINLFTKAIISHHTTQFHFGLGVLVSFL